MNYLVNKYNRLCERKAKLAHMMLNCMPWEELAKNGLKTLAVRGYQQTHHCSVSYAMTKVTEFMELLDAEINAD